MSAETWQGFRFDRQLQIFFTTDDLKSQGLMNLCLIDLLKKCLGIINGNITRLDHEITATQASSLCRAVWKNRLNKGA